MWDNVGKRMSGFFFSGTTVAKLDEKGRFVLPQEKRYGLVEEENANSSSDWVLGAV